MKPNTKVFINFRLFLSLFFWLLCILTHKKLSEKTYELGMSIKLTKEKPLYDIIQAKFPNLQHLRSVPECLHMIPIIALISFIAHYRNDNSVSALISFFLKHGVLMLLRGMLFTSTLLPDSSQMCSISTHIGSCFDLIFSGHTTIMYLCTHIINEYFYISRTVYSLLHLNNLITSFFIITCRNHYTIDVLIAMIMTHFVCNYKN
jgi:hypothetical protein